MTPNHAERAMTGRQWRTETAAELDNATTDEQRSRIGGRIDARWQRPRDAVPATLQAELRNASRKPTALPESKAEWRRIVESTPTNTVVRVAYPTSWHEPTIASKGTINGMCIWAKTMHTSDADWTHAAFRTWKEQPKDPGDPEGKEQPKGRPPTNTNVQRTQNTAEWARYEDRGSGRLAKTSDPASVRQNERWATTVRVQPVPIDNLDAEDTVAEKNGTVFTSWKPPCGFTTEGETAGWTPPAHTVPLVESEALGRTRIPMPRAQQIPQPLIEEGTLSNAQVDALLRIMTIWSDGERQRVRQGFMLADGTGTGKGRIIAASIACAWAHPEDGQRCRRALWVSQTPDLYADARRDWTDITGDPGIIHSLAIEQTSGDPEPLPNRDGVLFAAHHHLRDPHRVREIGRWLSGGSAMSEANPVIAFDECHLLAGQSELGDTHDDTTSGRAGRRSLQGQGALELTAMLPKARILYTSATAVRDIAAYRYTPRLMLWGPHTGFPDQERFHQALVVHGLAGLEVVAHELRQRGQTLARSIDMASVVTDSLRVDLTGEQRDHLDIVAEAWKIILAGVENASRGQSDHQALMRVAGIRHAFFAYLLSALKAEGIIHDIRQRLDAGQAPVVQLVNTHQRATERGLRAAAAAEGWTGPLTGLVLHPDAPDLDLSPVPEMAEMLRAAFPVAQTYEDRDGRRRVVRDASGEPASDPRLVLARDQAVGALNEITGTIPLLDQLVWAFGHELAEVSGRSLRTVPLPERTTADGRPWVGVDRRRPQDGTAEAKEFQADARRVLVFTEAGATGRSFHADARTKNQRQRVHYLAEIHDAVTKIVQALGRTLRAGQLSAPIMRPVASQLPGEQRYAAHATWKLARLGAGTQGDHRTQTEAARWQIPDYHGPAGREALRRLMRDCATFMHGQSGEQGAHGAATSASATPMDPERWHGLSRAEARIYFGRMADNRQNLSITRYLNQLVTMRPDVQDELATAFDAHHRATLADRRKRGLRDETIAGQRTDRILQCGGMPLGQLDGRLWAVFGHADKRTSYPPLAEDRAELAMEVRALINETETTLGRNRLWLRPSGDSLSARMAWGITRWDRASQKWAFLAFTAHGCAITEPVECDPGAGRLVTRPMLVNQCYIEYLPGTFNELADECDDSWRPLNPEDMAHAGSDVLQMMQTREDAWCGRSGPGPSIERPMLLVSGDMLRTLARVGRTSWGGERQRSRLIRIVDPATVVRTPIHELIDHSGKPGHLDLSTTGERTLHDQLRRCYGEQPHETKKPGDGGGGNERPVLQLTLGDLPAVLSERA